MLSAWFDCLLAGLRKITTDLILIKVIGREEKNDFEWLQIKAGYAIMFHFR